MSGIVGSKINHRGSGTVAKLGTDGQHLLSSGAGKSANYETIASTEFDDDKIQSNIALLGFKTAVNGSLAKYNLQDQIIDEFEDATGVDASASTNESLVAGTGTDYYYGSVAGSISGADATGSYSGYASYTMLDDGDIVVTGSGTVDFMLVAGGGAGGTDTGGEAGGGGAGGMRVITSYSLTAGTKSIVIGAGGAGTGYDKGANSTALGYTATGGGFGGGHVPSAGTGGVGGSGGGGGGEGDSRAAGAGNEGGFSPVEGYAGYQGFYNGTRVGGGGGGAGGVAAATSSGNAGAAGTGVNNDYRTGSDVMYAGGGAGGHNGTANGGGGAPNTAGTANTGGGGGGGTNGAAGGSGIFVMRIATGALLAPGDLTLQSVDTTAKAEPDYADMVLLIEDAAGTATLNTDIKGYVSEDSGTTFTQGTLVDEGTWGTNKKIVAFHDLDISAQSGTSMCYKITTHNQAAAKSTRIHAASIGWKE